MTVRIVLQRGLAATLLGLLLTSCGGGGDQVDPFEPERLLVFGDEASVITAAGLKYTVNANDPLNTGTATPTDDRTDLVPLNPAGSPNTTLGISCTSNPLWIQVVAAEYGFSFDECKPVDAVDPQRGRIYAQVGTGVAELPAQLAAHGAFLPTDLVTVFTGQKDIIDIYQSQVSTLADCRYSSASNAGAAAIAARQRGVMLKVMVDDVADNGSGGRVLFVTQPNVGATPFGRAEKAANTDFDRAECLSNLTNAFNAGLRATGVQDGRLIGLVAIDEQLQVIVDNASSFGFSNVADPACTVALPNCTSDTRVAAAKTTLYLWADALHFGAEFHQRLGTLARFRATNNPF